VRLVTLDIVVNLTKSMTLEGDSSGEAVESAASVLDDVHFAEIEGVREESTLLLRNFYKVNL